VKTPSHVETAAAAAGAGEFCVFNGEPTTQGIRMIVNF
jgi:hypothetical protein